MPSSCLMDARGGDGSAEWLLGLKQLSGWQGGSAGAWHVAALGWMSALCGERGSPLGPGILEESGKELAPASPQRIHHPKFKRESPPTGSQGELIQQVRKAG